jgi:hypothetical protein
MSGEAIFHTHIMIVNKKKSYTSCTLRIRLSTSANAPRGQPSLVRLCGNDALGIKGEQIPVLQHQT